MAPPLRLLLVDDDQVALQALAELLSYEGFEVEVAPGVQAALTLIGDFRPDVILSDMHMPALSGIDLLRAVREKRWPAIVLMMTSSSTDAMEQHARQLGAADILEKPLEITEVVSRIQRALDAHSSLA